MTLERFDEWLAAQGPVAVTVKEELEPVHGKDSVFFPPTFAPPQGSTESPGYVIDDTGNGKVVLVDTVGSQANRMEPLFKESPYADLVPKAAVKIGPREISLLDAGHRAADAVVRFSDKWDALRNAFLAIRDKRDATALAKLAPTSLVFGVWDSRDTQVKLPRLVGSTIRAHQVEKLTRAAQFFAATEKDETEGLASQDFLSAAGLDDAPAGRTNGGVISRGGIRREAVLNLVALRALTGSNGETPKLQRYILGLALVALMAPSERFLREGCLLAPAEGRAAEMKLVERTGKRSELKLADSEALEFARLTANAFGVGAAWTATFDADAVKKAADKKKEEKDKKAAKAKQGK
jgi:CRISPR-associated protein Csb1